MPPVTVIFCFQAEDGIRDVAVTGVQTCALPISLGSKQTPRPPPFASPKKHLAKTRTTTCPPAAAPSVHPVRLTRIQCGSTTRGLANNPAALSDRKSTRLNSSHGYISYAVFCLKKKKQRE